MSVRYEEHRQSRCALSHEQIFDKRQSEYNYTAFGNLPSKSVPFEILDRLQATRAEKEEKHESRRERYAAQDRRMAQKREQELEERKKKRLQHEARQSGSQDPVVSHWAQYKIDQREEFREQLRLQSTLRSRANDNDFFHQTQLHKIKREAWQLRFDKNILGLDGYIVPPKEDDSEENEAPPQSAPSNHGPTSEEIEIAPIVDIWAHIPSPDEEDACKGKDSYQAFFGRDSKIFSKKFLAPKSSASDQPHREPKEKPSQREASSHHSQEIEVKETTVDKEKIEAIEAPPSDSSQEIVEAKEKLTEGKIEATGAPSDNSQEIAETKEKPVKEEKKINTTEAPQNPPLSDNSQEIAEAKGVETEKKEGEATISKTQTLTEPAQDEMAKGEETEADKS